MYIKIEIFLFLVGGLNILNAHIGMEESSSEGCNSSSSPYYEDISNFMFFATINSCLQSDVRLLKGISATDSSTFSALQYLTIPVYSRAQFGNRWADGDGDCQNSLHETLIIQSTTFIRFKSDRECQVTAGRCISPYTGAVIYDSKKIDIDHLVPLKWAWDHGADRWPQTKRERFANDPVNLLSVEASLNRQKSAKGLDEWLPSASLCQYVARFMQVITVYKLELSPFEAVRYASIRTQKCLTPM